MADLRLLRSVVGPLAAAMLLALVLPPGEAHGNPSPSGEFKVLPIKLEDTGDKEKEKKPDLADPRNYRIRPPGWIDTATLVVKIDGLNSGGDGRCRYVSALLDVELLAKPAKPADPEPGATDLPVAAVAVKTVSVSSERSQELPDGSAERPYTEAITAVAGPQLLRRRPKVEGSPEDGGLEITISGVDIAEELPGILRPLLERFMDHEKVRRHLACLDLDPELDETRARNPKTKERERVQEAMATRHQIHLALDQALSRSFEGSLGMAYGFSKDQRHVDVEPGMRLCLRSVESLKRRPETGDRKPKSLIRQGPAQCVAVGWRQDEARGALTSFDPLLSRFKNFRVGQKDAGDGTQSGGSTRRVADGVDLSDPGSARRFYRLFYPPVIDRWENIFPAADSSAAFLVGVDEPSALECISAFGFKNVSRFCGLVRSEHEEGPDASACPSKPVCYRFNEQAVPTPEIRIEVNRNWLWVPLGTTLFDVLAQLGAPEIVEFSSVGGEVAHRRASKLLSGAGGFELRRRFGFELAEVDFDEVGTGALYLPLMQGDRIKW